MKTYILGHRGASGEAPENTKAAFDKALQQGADGVELDVQMTKDGHAVVIHDEKVNRTTDGSGYIKNKSLEEIRSLDSGSYYHSSYKGEKILSLEESLKILEKAKLINIELKGGGKGLEEEVIKLIRKMGFERQVLLSSFNHYSMKKISELAPELKTGVLHVAGLYEPWEYAKNIGASTLNTYYKAARKEMVKRIQRENMQVVVYTVNKEKDIRKMLNLGVDVLITDYPALGVRLRQEIQ